jgi:predicted RNA binding protein YcfA (HicA-like mRNA interferase family)
MSKTFSGKEIIHILSKYFGFKQIGISGSHVKMTKKNDGIKITTIIPLHKEVFIGTFKSILRQAQISSKEFIQKSLD